ncbi:MAG: hypothetical protein WA001_05310 [Patescibacteria group bacterium]
MAEDNSNENEMDGDRPTSPEIPSLRVSPMDAQCEHGIPRKDCVFCSQLRDSVLDLEKCEPGGGGG